MKETCKTEPRPKTVKEFFRSWYFWKPFLGVMAGGILGFMYYHFIGCTSGTCPITSHPVPSVLFGGFFGFVITSGPCTKC
jgi:hypothetical protein